MRRTRNAGWKIRRARWSSSWRIAFAIMLATPVAGAAAEPVRVRSGEHPGFSRLVLDFGQVPHWSVTLDGLEGTVTFEGPPLLLDASEVHDRIGRGRIRSVRAEANGLHLALGCDCVVEAYALPGGRLVIDVGERSEQRPVGAGTGFAQPRVLDEGTGDIRPARAVSEAGPVVPAYEPWPPVPFEAAERRLPRSAFESHAPPSRQPPRPPATVEPESFSGRAGSAPPDSPREGVPVSEATSPGIADPAPVPWPLETTDVRNRLDAATDAVADALERAAAQGLIELASEGQTSGPASPAPDRPPTPDAPPSPLPIEQESNLRVSTSVDRELSLLARRLEDAAGSSCLAGYDLDVASWGPPEDKFADVAELHARLFGEFDAPDADTARTLARHYIHLSFGAEALAVLEAVALPDDEAAVLGLLAEIADGGTRPVDDAIVSLFGCPGPAAMWGLLAVADPPPDAPVATEEIAGVFSELPLHLRRHFGPVLVDRFLALGDPDAARTVWTAVDRAAGDHGEGFVLATAELASAEGDSRRAERGYATLTGAGPANAPLAVLRLLRSRLERGGPVDRGLVETASALSFENRGTPMARELKLVELEGRIAIGAWDEVLAELPRARFSGALGSEDAASVLGKLYVAMATRANVADFLRRGVEANANLPGTVVADGARRALAERFLDLGLADRADALLAELAEPLPADKLLKARAHMVAGRYGEVEETLAGETGPETETLRGEALLGLGRYREASVAFEGAGNTNAAARSAARGGAWERGPEPVRAAAKALLEEDREPLAETPLARNRALVGNAGVLRDEISALLAIAGASDGDEVD